MKNLNLFLFAVLFSMISGSVFPQKRGQERIDSLMKRLPSEKTDTVKVKILCDLSRTWAYMNSDEGMKYGEQALELATRIKWKRGIAGGHLWIGLNFMMKSEFQKSLEHYSNSLQLAEEMKDKNLEGILYNYIGWVYEYICDYPTALKYYKESLKIHTLLGEKKYIPGMLSNIGVIYDYLSRYDTALFCYKKAVDLNRALGDSFALAGNYQNMGIIYYRLSDYPKSLEYYFKALKIGEDRGDKGGLAQIYSNMGNTYFAFNNPEKALEYQFKALKIFEELGNKFGIAGRLNDIGLTYKSSDTAKAMEYFMKALKINEETGNKNFEAINLINIGTIFHIRSDYGKSIECFRKALKISKEIGSIDNYSSCYAAIGEAYRWVAIDPVNKILLNELFKGNKTEALKKSLAYADSAIKMLRSIGNLKDLKDTYFITSDIYERLGRYDSALVNYKRFVLFKDSIYNEASIKKFAALEARRAEELHQKQMVIKDLQLKKTRNERWYFVGGLFLLVCLSGVLYNRYRFKTKANKIITAEKKRSDELLLNILPSEVAEELKEKGYADARQFEEVTVLFTDFKGFTEISEQMSPQQLVKDIDACYKEFDRITTKYGIEKIKTIGDSYMCAGGLPVENKTNPADCVKAALEIRDFMLEGKKKYQSEGKPFFEIRIGIHTGPVVAGIVGIKKFAYDIWGDTVNIASRMESSGESGKVNISGTTYELVKEEFNCTYRGKIEAKNKGLIDMYFVE